MIARTASLFALIYALGFVFFALTLAKPAADDAKPTEAAVVLTLFGEYNKFVLRRLAVWADI